MPEAETSEFLLRACHDLRTAVRAIRAHSELLLKQAAPAENGELSERLAFIAEGAKKIDRVVDGLSDYSLALQIHEEDFTKVPMEALLRTAMAKLADSVRACGAEVTHGPLPAVPGSADRLLQLWEALLASALDRCREATVPRIGIHSSAQGTEQLFAVRDNGPFAPEEMDQLFRPFASRLAICRTIVERHGGRIWPEAQTDGTLAIFFTLPAG